MDKTIRRLTAAALALCIMGGTLSAYAQPSEEQYTDSVTEPEPEQVSLPDFTQSMVYLQNGMRAVTITPTVDFYTGEQNDYSLAQELSEICETASSYGMNALIIESDCEGEAYYDLDLDSTGRGAVGSAIDAARDAGLYAYITLDVNMLISSVLEQGGDLKNGFSAAVHKFVMKYPCGGVILKNYYTSDTPEMFAEYMRSGSGIGYENWLYETNEYVIRSISEIIRRTDNTVAAGLLISDMWANSSSNEEGSATADTVQALYDGFCDTKKYVEKGYADFVMVKAYGSTSDGSLGFGNVVSWWYELAQSAGAKLYVLHLNDRIGQYSGWYEDQLLQQLTVMENYDGIGGSAFSSLSSLRANPLGTTDTLLKYFDKQINTETIFDSLEMISPTSLSFVTYDSAVKFMGTFDENFDVFFDGKKVQLNEAGNFYFQEDLNVGWNSFVIEHKGKQYKYSIERRVEVLKSIENEKNITIEGGTKIALVAVAYSGSKVSATIGGTVVTLKEKEGSGEELDANSSYAKFVGYYTAADGIIGQEQYLGDISFYASYKGYEKYMTGGSVTIEAKPEPPKQDFSAEIIKDQSSAGTGEVVGTMAPIVSDEEYVTYVRTVSDFTKVYDGKTTGDIPSPLFTQLPANTLDYYKSESGGYITTTSGKRFESGDVTTFTDTGLGYNALVVKSVGNSGGNSFIKFHLRYKSSFNVTVPVTYHNELDGAYGVSSYLPAMVYITFDNITSVTKLPDFSYCTLFSAGEWETVEENGVPKFRLALTLRQAGIYSGCAAKYDENGDLVLSFAVPTASLSGKVIVIDPGHGYGKTAAKLDPGAVGYVTEQSVNLAVSKVLEQKLTAMGATVVRLKTESEFILTDTRPTVARAYGADMYISLHCNSALNEEAHGVEVYYFTAFSQPLAYAINSELAYYYDNKVYKDGTNSDRGAKYSYYWVTLEQDFPSVLVEMGFVTNERESMVMADPAYQDGIAQSIANGVYTYFARSGLAYSGSGSSDAPEGSGGASPETSQPEQPPQSGMPVEPDPPSQPELPELPPEETEDVPETEEPSEPTYEDPDTAEPDIPDEPNEPEPPEETEDSGITEPDIPPYFGGIPVD